MTIQELKEDKRLSVGASSVCLVAHLNTLEDVLLYYLENQTFKDIRGCGATKDNELIALCQEHLSESDYNLFQATPFNIKPTTSIIKLTKHQYLSRQAYVVCQEGHLFTVSAILERYNKHGSFWQIDGCNKSTDEGLIRFCQSVYNIELGIVSHPEQGCELSSNAFDPSVFEKLTPTKRDALEIRFEVLWHQLPIRIKNAYNKITNITALDYYLENRIYIYEVLSKQSHVGNLQEWHHMESNLTEYAINLVSLNESESIYEYNKELIAVSLGQYFDTNRIPVDINKNILFFQYAYLLINDAILQKADQLNSKEQYLLQNYGLYFTDSQCTTLEVASKACGVTRERIRQIRNRFFETGFQGAFSHVQKLKTKVFERYNIDKESALVYLNTHQTALINETENTKFSSLLMTKLIALLLFDTHTLVGNEIEIHNENKPRYEASLNNVYIIANEINAHFYVNDFLNDIYARLSDAIKEKYQLPIRGIIAKYVTGEDKWNITEHLVPLVGTLLFEEFNLVVQDEKITFDRNTRKLDYEYAKEALESFLPSPVGYHITAILERVHELYPDRDDLTASSLASAIIRERDVFGAIGRQSIYILRSWETLLSNAKAGTIRNIVEEYLLQQEEIRHINDIAVYVIEKRPDTYERSILDNLKADKSGRFKFFPNYRVGLSSKSYDLGALDVKGKPTFNSRTSDLRAFIDKHNRKPVSVSDKYEQRLYHFMKKYFLQIRSGEMPDYKYQRWTELSLPTS